MDNEKENIGKPSGIGKIAALTFALWALLIGRRFMLQAADPLRWAFLIGRKFMYGAEPLRQYEPIFTTLAVFPVGLFLQGALLKALGKKDASPAMRDIARALAFLSGAILVLAGDFTGTIFAERSLSQYRPMFLAELFAGIAALYSVRSGLARLIYGVASGKWADDAWKYAVGYADFAMIVALGATAKFFGKAVGVRSVVFILVVAGVRLAWAYIPDDRLEVVREFIRFLDERKLWWMAPIFVVMALLMILVMLTQSTGGSFPFIYAVF